MLWGDVHWLHYTQYLVMTYNGKESKTHTHTKLNHFAVDWDTVNQLYFNIKKENSTTDKLFWFLSYVFSLNKIM